MGNVYRFERLDSTNTKALALARDGTAEAAVIAKIQTGGRGRLGRRFESPAGGLYLSVLTERIPAGEGALAVPPAAALAVRKAIEDCFGLSCAIKHPNDLLLGGKKVCGILCESVSLPGCFCVVIGAGVNLRTDWTACARPADFADAAYPPGSLHEFSEKACSPDAFAALEKAVLNELSRLIEDFAAGRGLDEAAYRRYCLNCPETIVQV